MKDVTPQRPKRTWVDRAGEVVDSVVSIFAPVTGAKRRAFRARMSIAYEDRDRRGSRTDETRAGAWIGSRLSPDSEIERSLEDDRSKSRELYRTDSIGGMVDSRTNLVVGSGFTPQARIKERPGLATAEQAKRWNQELEDIYAQTAPRISQCGKRSLWQLCRLVEAHHGFDGESITILHDRGDAEKPIPLTLEVVDPQRLQTPPDKVNNPRVRLGVEYDATGKIVAYHIRDDHPGDPVATEKYTRYAADRVLHVFEPLFAGQSRGLPWLLRNLNRVKDAADLDEAAIIAAQVEACFTAIITPAFGSGVTAATAAATGTSATGQRLQEMRPGQIHYVDEGGQVHFSTPVKGNGYAPLQEWNFRRIAAGANYPYEMITKNWTGLSFAGGRLSLAEARLFAKSRQGILREMWLCKIWERMVFEAVVIGETIGVTLPARLYNKARWWFHRHEWTAPAWPFVLTPGEEIKAADMAVKANFRTKASVCAEYEGDFEDIAAQRAEERKLEKELGIDPITSELKPDDQEPTSPQELEMERQAA